MRDPQRRAWLVSQVAEVCDRERHGRVCVLGLTILRYFTQSVMRFQGPEMTLPGGTNLGKLVDWKAQVLDLTEEGTE